MTTQTLLAQLDNVRPRGAGKWSARCPAHPDNSPSLSVRECDRRVLMHCFSGCTIEEICAALDLTLSDLFQDAPDSRTAYRQHAQRTHARHSKAQRDEVDGFTLDALRGADYFTRSRQGLDISTWTHERLNDELDTLADAQALLWTEELTQWN